MTKFMELRQLQNGVRVRVQFARRDTEDGLPDWHKPEVVTLRIKYRQRSLRVRGGILPAGEITHLSIHEKYWAEYRQTDYNSEYKEFLNEEYRMRILEVL
jgi:hypothetical protein